MNRALALGLLATLGTLTVAVVAAQAPAGPGQAALAATKIEKVADNLYVITGSSTTPRETFSGGNTGVFVTDKGVETASQIEALREPRRIEGDKSNEPV